jgi:hypothetical protein
MDWRFSMSSKPVLPIDLSGPDGNAFAVVGHASRALKQLGKSRAEIDAFKEKCLDGTYEDLLNTVREHFALPGDDEE